MMEWLNHIDTEIFLFLNGLHNSFFDGFMYWVTNKYIWIPLYVIFLVLIIRKYKWNTVSVIIFVTMMILVSDQLSVHLFKNTMMRLRPCHEPALEGMVHMVNNECGGQYGFISSHAANVYALATFLSIILKNWYKHITAIVFIWATLVAYSRIYLGVHYPGDILVGGLMGMVLGFIMAKSLLFSLRKVLQHR